MMLIVLITFCFITGIHGCEVVNSDCLVYPDGCDDDHEEICCTVSWKVDCCCKDISSMTNAVTESFYTTYSFISVPNATDSMPMTTQTSEKFKVQVSFDRAYGNRNMNMSLNASLTGGNVRILYAASDNTTSLRMHLDARSIFIVSSLVLLAIVLIFALSCILICYSDRLRLYFGRILRRYLHERYSPPPSIIDL